jgi:hypothetical protein
MTILATIGLTTLASGLLGYIGPGPGLSMIGALIGLIVTVVAAIGSVLFWPIRKMLGKTGGEEAEEADEIDDETADQKQLEDGSDEADALPQGDK